MSYNYYAESIFNTIKEKVSKEKLGLRIKNDERLFDTYHSFHYYPLGDTSFFAHISYQSHKSDS